jgi:hypothetical protein
VARHQDLSVVEQPLWIGTPATADCAVRAQVPVRHGYEPPAGLEVLHKLAPGPRRLAAPWRRVMFFDHTQNDLGAGGTPLQIQRVERVA